MLAATFRRMWGGAIPASAYKQGIGVAFKQPVIILHVSFRAMSTCPVCLERPPRRTGIFSCRKTKRQCGCSYGSWMSSHLEFVNFRRRLFLVFTFALVLRACCLKLNVRSSVTPMYMGLCSGQAANHSMSHRVCVWHLCSLDASNIFCFCRVRL